jgi:hypothetical protein
MSDSDGGRASRGRRTAAAGGRASRGAATTGGRGGGAGASDASELTDAFGDLSLYTSYKHRFPSGYAYIGKYQLPSGAWEHLDRIRFFKLELVPTADNNAVEARIQPPGSILIPLSIDSAAINTRKYTLRFGRPIGKTRFVCNYYLSRIGRDGRWFVDTTEVPLIEGCIRMPVCEKIDWLYCVWNAESALVKKDDDPPTRLSDWRVLDSKTADTAERWKPDWHKYITEFRQNKGDGGGGEAAA